MDLPERDHDETAGCDEPLRAELREAAAAHVPDRARMLARVERGLAARPAAPAARPAPWLRAAGAALAVVAVVAAAALVVPVLPGPDGPPGPAVPAATGSTSATATAPATGTAPTGTAPSTGTAPPTGTAPAITGTPSTAATTGAPPAPTPLPLTVTGVIDPGSNRYWAQSDLTLTVPAPLTALTVELRVAQTGGVASTGHWRTLPPEDFTVSVREADGALVYRWTLKAGRTAPAGRHVFAAQYDHAEGERAAESDTYTVTATDASGRRATAHGGFAPRQRPPR
ncbi:hypothetical protein [Streptomyces roseoviridis]|uniref:hypothetical protein n=1 Tax=Streptomyces roseoviridis TaxID=67361 RepID=UPI0031EC56B4